MNVTVIPGRLLTAAHVERWAELQQAEASCSSPFLNPEFTQAVASVRDDVWIAVLEEGGRMAGFFPFQRGRSFRGQPVGGLLNDVQGVIAQRGLKWDAAELIRRCRLLQWTFPCVRVSESPFGSFHIRQDVSWLIDVRRGYDAYVAAKAGTLGSPPLQRKVRRLERRAGPLRFELHSADPALLATLMKWKADRYARHGYADVFGIPWVRRVLEGVHATQTPRFAGVLSVLYAGERVAAVHMGLRSRWLWHAWLTSYAPEFARYSPGLMLLLKMAEAAPTLGVQAIELGGGQYPYKERFANSSIRVAAGTVDRIPMMTIARRCRESGEDWIRRSRMVRPPARAIFRMYRRVRHRLLPA